jgi:hypothetical protein
VGDILARVMQNLFDRIDGPMEIRLVIQPIMAAIIATRDGIKDARLHHRPYGLSLLVEPDHVGIGFEMDGGRYGRSVSSRWRWTSSISSFSCAGSTWAKP